MSNPVEHHGVHMLRHATEHDGWEGAAAGALGVAGTTALALGAAGLMLTPLGWGLALGTGAVAGGSGLLKKMFGS